MERERQTERWHILSLMTIFGSAVLCFCRIYTTVFFSTLSLSDIIRYPVFFLHSPLSHPFVLKRKETLRLRWVQSKHKVKRRKRERKGQRDVTHFLAQSFFVPSLNAVQIHGFSHFCPLFPYLNIQLDSSERTDIFHKFPFISFLN